MADQQPYRSREEPVQVRREHDPIHLLEQEILEKCILAPDQAAEYRLRIRDEIDQAAEEAMESPEPEPEHALEDVYAEAETP